MAHVTRLSATVLKVNGARSHEMGSPFGPDIMYIIGGKASRIVIDAGEGCEEDLMLLLDAMSSEHIKEITDVLVTHYHADFYEGIHRLRARLGLNVRIWRLPWPKGLVETAAGITSSAVEADAAKHRLARRWSSVKDLPTLNVRKLDEDGEIMTASGDAKVKASLHDMQWRVDVYDGKQMWLRAQFEGRLKLTKTDDSDQSNDPMIFEPSARTEVATQTNGGDLFISSSSEAAAQTDGTMTPRISIHHTGTQTSPLEQPQELTVTASAVSQKETKWHQSVTTLVGLRITLSAAFYKFVWSALLLLAIALAMLAMLDVTCLARSITQSAFCLWFSAAAESIASPCLFGLVAAFEWIFPPPASPPPRTAWDYFWWFASALRCMWQDMEMPSAVLQTMSNAGGMLYRGVGSLRNTASLAVDGLLSAGRLLHGAPARLVRQDSLDPIAVILSASALCAVALCSCCARRHHQDDGLLTARNGITTPPTRPHGSRSASPAPLRDDEITDHRRNDNGWYMQLRDGKWFHA